MNLLNKIKQVKIDHSKTLLQGEDLEVCSAIEKDYLNAFSFYENEIEFFNINAEFENNQFLNLSGAVQAVEKYVEKNAESYVEKIVRHFGGKYKITLNEEDIKKRVVPENDYHIKEREREKIPNAIDRIQKFKFPLTKILDQIQDKLGGMSLDEVSEKEIKDKFFKDYARSYKGYNRKDASCALSKDKITFERGPYLEAAWSGSFTKFHHSSGVVGLAIALSYFESKSKDVLPVFAFMKPWDDIADSFLFSEIEINLEKIKSIRFYKNRKMVIRFQNNEIANEFFKVWCREAMSIEE